MAKKQKQKISLGTAIAGLLLNVILLPGLGSLIGRKTQPGILQLIFFLLSIILDFTIIGLIIGIIYMIPAMILILIAIGNVLYSIALQFGLNQGLNFGDKISDQLIQSSLLQNTAMIPIFIIGVLLALLAAYLTPIAIMKFVDKYNFKKAFELKSVFRKAFTGKYFIAVLAVIAYSLIIGLLASALSLGFSSINVQFLTAVMGLIISGLSGFMTLITTYTIFGEVYSKLK